MSFDDAKPTLSREELHVLKDLLRQACGFVLREDLAFVVERRLGARLEALGLPDFTAYNRYLRYDARASEELDIAVELVMPHETYFFREPTQLEAFATELLPQLHRTLQADKELRLWSAGCSSGEEPYSLAMLVREAGLFDTWDLDILGTDLSKKALATARHAEYGTSAMRVVTPAQLLKHFEPASAGKHRVLQRYRDVVRFGHINLLEAASMATVSPVHVILCRNVLIYFDVETRRAVLDRFFERLVPGGYLLLGHSENLLSLSTRFELVHLEGDLVYRRPAV